MVKYSQSIKRRLRNVLSYLLRLYLHFVRLVFGSRYILYRLDKYSYWIGVVGVLEILGATLGNRISIRQGLQIQNALDGNCSNLNIGDHVYVGPSCLFDLASAVRIEDEVALSARVSLVTHADVADRPLSGYFPRKEGPIVIGKGSWIGVNTTILHGVTIGQCSVVGAMSLVNRDIPDKVMAYGIPCKVVKAL